MDGNESGEFNFPGREFWHPLQSFPEIYSMLTVKAESEKFLSFWWSFEILLHFVSFFHKYKSNENFLYIHILIIILILIF